MIFLTHQMTFPTSGCFLCIQSAGALTHMMNAPQDLLLSRVSPATRGRSKDLQPPYNVVITGGTKGTPSLSFLCHKDCLTSLVLIITIDQPGPGPQDADMALQALGRR